MNSATTAPLPPSGHRAFTSFANADFRVFFFAATAAMMADNIEHVISYFVMFQKFHSPALGAFAVVSHWVPYLFFGGLSGRLADRFDLRRLIQIGMLLFMGVSISWGIMFMTDSSAVWKAAVLLVVHGLAGVIWIPASQVLIHKIVTVEQLPSAIRLTATGRYLAFGIGPAVGAGLLFVFGTAYGIFANALIYLPMFVWLVKVPYGRQHAHEPRAAESVNGFADIWSTMKVMAKNPVLASMTVLIGAASFFVGNAYQAQMPGFAADLGHERVDFAYSVLLAADAAGGLAGGVILESRGLLPPKPRTAFILAMVWCCALFGFARSTTYAVAITLLFAAGFVELGFNSMAQSLVQLNAPGEIRGRVLGVFSMSAMGLRTFSGLSVGLLGSIVGIHNSLSYSAAALLMLYAAIFAARNARGRQGKGGAR
ncbi:MAG TPA: MFS transporter [Steroidobacteraceae bacterium]|nr:MFS transporter [Steroidobacteraceae bacterium]